MEQKQTPEDLEDTSRTEQGPQVTKEYADDLREFIKKLRTLKPLNWPPSV
jgi:hypothetical protein